MVSPVEPELPDEKNPSSPSNPSDVNDADNDVNANPGNNTNVDNNTNEVADDPNAGSPSTSLGDNQKHQVIMQGNVYYVPGVQGKTRSELVAPTQIHKNGYGLATQSNLQTFPQTGNDSGTFMKVLGAAIAVLTLGVIDIRKVRH